jgi:pyruvate/2-oxoacid:ferredoxin oxidoreductase beta subunit
MERDVVYDGVLCCAGCAKTLVQELLSEIVEEIKLPGECLSIIGEYIYYATITPSEMSESKRRAKKIEGGDG